MLPIHVQLVLTIFLQELNFKETEATVWLTVQSQNFSSSEAASPKREACSLECHQLNLDPLTDQSCDS